MLEESLLTPGVRALVGSRIGTATIVISLKTVNRAMDTFLGHHRHDLHPGDPVPGYVMSALEPEAELGAIPELLPDTLLISNEWEFERPFRLGEELTLTGRIADISERFGGQFGYSIYFRSEAELRDANGEVAARAARTMMQYDTRNARAPGDDE